MEFDQLRALIRSLAQIEPNADPFLSCYVNLEEEQPADYWRRQRSILDGLFRGERRSLWLEAASRMEESLGFWDAGRHRSAVIFIRPGVEAHQTRIALRAPARSWVSCHPAPSLYGLAEIRDNYERFLLAVVSEGSCRLAEIDLGHAIPGAAIDGPEWESQASTQLERLVERRGHRFLVLAGPAWARRRFEQGLPRFLRARVVGSIDAVPQDSISLIARRATNQFVAWEDAESRAMVAYLKDELASGRGAVSGVDASRLALEQGRARLLILNSRTNLELSRLFVLEQGAGPFSVHDELVWLAERQGCPVEVVHDSRELARLGGAGCLLHDYRTARDLRQPNPVC
jgi:hypothetical protein